MKRHLVWSLLTLAALCAPLALWPERAAYPTPASAASAQSFALVKDINTTPQLFGNGVIRNPFGSIGNQMLFRASAPQTGEELWSTDGTADGTQLIKDIVPGEQGAFNDVGNTVPALIMGQRLLFVANDGMHGPELWASDGTAAGTQLIKDLFPGADGSAPSAFIASGSHAFFMANASANQRALWTTDGTPDGTVKLHTFASLNDAGVLVGTTLFFSAAASSLDLELWKSDGTPGGTVLVQDLVDGLNGSFPQNFFAASASEVWFSARTGAGGTYELWRSDGTAGGTERFFASMPALALRDPGPITMLPRSAQASHAGRFVFSADDGTHGQELWATDGTPANTVLLKDVNPNAGSASAQLLGSMPSPSGDGYLFYSLNDGSNGSEPWVTDGTPAGTKMLANIYPGSGSAPSTMVAVGSQSFFTALSAAGGRELWKTDGTPAGTAQAADIASGALSSDPEDLTAFNNLLYFSADDSVHGRELWQIDGGGQAALLKDIAAGGAEGVAGIIGAAAGALYFNADDGTSGWELWKTDGTAQGTQLLKNIAADTGGLFLSQRDGVSTLGDKLLFGVDLDSNGEALTASRAALWQSDGTAAGTNSIKPFPSSSPSGPVSGMTALSDSVLFTARGDTQIADLWRSDGTAAGTAVITNVVAPDNGSIYDMIRLNNLVLFDVFTSTLQLPDQTFSSIWRSDGSAAGTQPITGGIAFGTYDYAVSGSTLFFASAPDQRSANVELWKTDGTPAGTGQVAEIVDGDIGSSPSNITPGKPGEVFFTITQPTSEVQLWKSDGSAAGTVFVHTIQPQGPMVYAGGTLFFSASDRDYGTELWKSDGTDVGTSMLADIYPGVGSSAPDQLFELNGVLYFAATGPDGRRTLWRSDGSAAGTQPLRDDADAPLLPTDLAAAQGQLLFSAADATHGREIWRSDGSAAGTALMQDIVPGAGSSNPWPISAAGKQIYLTAYTPAQGRELWALASQQSGQPTPTPPGQSPDQPVYLPVIMR